VQKFDSKGLALFTLSVAVSRNTRSSTSEAKGDVKSRTEVSKESSKELEQMARDEAKLELKELVHKAQRFPVECRQFLPKNVPGTICKVNEAAKTGWML